MPTRSLKYKDKVTSVGAAFTLARQRRTDLAKWAAIAQLVPSDPAVMETSVTVLAAASEVLSGFDFCNSRYHMFSQCPHRTSQEREARLGQFTPVVWDVAR